MAEKKTGRKLVPARNKKKKWSKEDEAYLQDNWGTKSIKTICKNLGRSENAVIVRVLQRILFDAIICRIRKIKTSHF